MLLDIALNISLLVFLFISGGTHINGAGSHSRRISGLKMPFISTGVMMEFFPYLQGHVWASSIQECVFYLTVFINPMCFP